MRDSAAISQPLFLIKSMTTNFYLVVSRKGLERTTQTTPRLNPSEIAIRVTLEVPNSLFQTPQIQAAITFPRALPNMSPFRLRCRTMCAN
jgi:hypothetical protein